MSVENNDAIELTAGNIFWLTGNVKDHFMVHYLRNEGESKELSLYGSLNGENFKLIKTYNSETLETITNWYPAIAVATGNDAIKNYSDFLPSDDFGNSRILFYEDIQS
mgnify:CR=1 FL=1